MSKLNTLPEAVFKFVAVHLLTQNIHSKRGRMCAYRAPGGLSCAVGCIIPDSLYDEGFEGWSIDFINDEPSKDKNELRKGVFAGLLYLFGISFDLMSVQAKLVESSLRKLQLIHDKHEPIEWPELLEEFAYEVYGDDPMRMTNIRQQALFNRVAKHLASLPQPSRGPITNHDNNEETATMCAYRGQNNTKCAIGALIDDNFYNPSFEGHSLTSPFIADNELWMSLRESLGYEPNKFEIKLLQQLQNCHDCFEMSEWGRHLNVIAEGNNLSPLILSTLDFRK